MKIIFIALVIALTSSSLLVQEQTGSVVPEFQKRDITIPSANGDPIRISYGGNADSVKVDGNQLAAKQDLISSPNSNRRLQNEEDSDQAIVYDRNYNNNNGTIEAEEIATSDEIMEMSEDDTVDKGLINLAQSVLDDKNATMIQRVNAALVLLTPLEDSQNGLKSNNIAGNLTDDEVILSRDQANDIKAVIALLIANIPDDVLVEQVETVALNETPETVDDELAAEKATDEAEDNQNVAESTGSNDRRRNHLRSRRAKALRRVSRRRAVRRRRHRSMSIRNYGPTRHHRGASAFGRRRALRLSPPHFVRYNTAAHSRHLIGTPAPKVEAQVTAPVTENKEVV